MPIQKYFYRWPLFGFGMGKSKLFEEPALTDLSRVFESHVIIGKQEGRGVLTGLIQFKRAGLRKDNDIRGLNMTAVMGIQRAITQNDLSIRQKTGMKREDHVNPYTSQRHASNRRVNDHVYRKCIKA